MVGFNELGSGVPAEQIALLKSRNFTIRPLSTAGHLDTWRVLSLVWQPILVFLLCLLLLTATDFRYSSEAAMAVLYCAGLFALLVFPAAAFCLLFFGVVAAACKTRVRGSAVLYWMWWPFWRLVICVGAAFLGTYIGNHLWYSLFYPHTRMERLQAYTEIDPRFATSQRLQDAGIVAFSSSAKVDRARIGCLKDGSTFCVAPIIYGGSNVSNQSQDLFMAGVDCCDCPGDGEFRCGHWNTPGMLGGLRVLHEQSLSMYHKSAVKWASTYAKTVNTPTFFEWVGDPLDAYNELEERGERLRILAILLVPIMIILVTVVLNGILEFLCKRGFAAQIETPPPPPGLGRALSARFLPHLHKHHELQQDEEFNAPNPKYVIL
mmetsp:Transcript_67513/g.170347  ORF Transcript_67513/g.170347 Transcript_67513/m.170347 type:complete len:377 (-) Transcript_67513:8-1138(-)